MWGNFRRAFTRPRTALLDKLPSPVDLDVDSELHNRLSEVQLLQGHSDIVRVLVRIDDARLASASDDRTVIVWDTSRGRPLHTLKGHAQKVTCLLYVPQPPGVGGPVLVSGAADKTLRFWNVDDGTERGVPRAEHTGAVKCLALLDGGAGSFCSGASDGRIVLWSARSCEPSGVIERPESDYLHAILPIRNGRLVVASESSLLIYDTETLSLHKTLSSPSEKAHREAVCCLASTPGGFFASASLDGEIKLWSMKTLNCVKSLNYDKEYLDPDHKFTFSVQHLVPVDERYLLTAVGSGFSLWDVVTGECLLSCPKAHRATVEHVLTLYNNERIITCSADSSLRVWGPESLLQQTPTVSMPTGLGRRLSMTGPIVPATPPTPTAGKNTGIEAFFTAARRGGQQSSSDKLGAVHSPSSPALALSSASSPAINSGYNTTLSPATVERAPSSPGKEGREPSITSAVCVAELLAHTGAIKVAVALSESSFAAAGSDHLISIWKDAAVEGQRRNEHVQTLLARYLATAPTSTSSSGGGGGGGGGGGSGSGSGLSGGDSDVFESP